MNGYEASVFLRNVVLRDREGLIGKILTNPCVIYLSNVTPCLPKCPAAYLERSPVPILSSCPPGTAPFPNTYVLIPINLIRARSNVGTKRRPDNQLAGSVSYGI